MNRSDLMQAYKQRSQRELGDARAVLTERKKKFDEAWNQVVDLSDQMEDLEQSSEEFCNLVSVLESKGWRLATENYGATINTLEGEVLSTPERIGAKYVVVPPGTSKITKVIRVDNKNRPSDYLALASEVSPNTEQDSDGDIWVRQLFVSNDIIVAWEKVLAKVIK